MTSFISIPNKPDIEIAYRLERISSLSTSPPSTHLNPIWIVFLNGLTVPMSTWDKVVALLRAKYEHIEQSQRGLAITCLRYDRYNFGETKNHNSCHETELHDLTDAAVDLHQLISSTISKKHDHTPNSPPPKIILVAHSFGVVLARWYMNSYPGTILALLSVDSNLANSDFVSIYPDPDSNTFNSATDLPDGTSVSDLRAIRSLHEAILHPKQPNDEGLDRRAVPTLLPAADEPKLLAPDGKGP